MSESLSMMAATMAWPLAIAVAWLAGEFGYRWLSLPRISSYGIAGFFMAASQGGFLAAPSGSTIPLLADFAFSLMLFELGFRINLRWLRADPWLGVTSVAEAGTTFAAVFVLAQWFGVPMTPSLLLAALAMSTSPAAVVRVVNELKSSGQVTERLLHLSAFNCVLAVVVFKMVTGYWILSSAGSLFHAAWNSLMVVAVSAGIGVLFGVAVPMLLRVCGAVGGNATVAFAIAVLLLTALTLGFSFSPLLAALVFGLVARHRRVIFSQAQNNFGALGDLLTVLLFVFVAASVEWKQVVDGAVLALAVLGVRLAAKTLSTTLFARLSGITWRKGMLTGLAMTPMSVLVILLLEHSRHIDLGNFEQVAGIAAIVIILEVAGPVLTRLALMWAGEARR